MSTSNWKVDQTIVARADLSAKQYQPINRSGALSTTDEDVVGILQNKPVANQHATVARIGATKIYMPVSLGDGALVMGDSVTSGFIALATSGYLAFGEIVTAAASGSIGTAWLYGGPVRRLLA